jgi:hypothetical protein
VSVYAASASMDISEFVFFFSCRHLAQIEIHRFRYLLIGSHYRDLQIVPSVISPRVGLNSAWLPRAGAGSGLAFQGGMHPVVGLKDGRSGSDVRQFISRPTNPKQVGRQSHLTSGSLLASFSDPHYQSLKHDFSSRPQDLLHISPNHLAVDPQLFLSRTSNFGCGNGTNVLLALFSSLKPVPWLLLLVPSEPAPTVLNWDTIIPLGLLLVPMRTDMCPTHAMCQDIKKLRM